MRTLVSAAPETSSSARSRLIDYLELTKPKVGVLVLFTVAAGLWLASGGPPQPALLIHTLVGTGLVVAGASALNQLLERKPDACMRRTENRPLPAARLQPAEVVVFGLSLGFTGVLYLWLSVPYLLTSIVAAVAFVSYVFIYTPLKSKTTLNTLIGAVPGALPPIIGWTAVTGAVDPPALVLFLILYLWQVPHFLAIAWIYREDYARAGLQMLPVLDVQGTITARQMVSYCLVLIAVSLLPAFWGLTGRMYTFGALVLGFFFLLCTIRFIQDRSVPEARRVLRASLIYLPALLALLLLDARTGANDFVLWR
jgi:protoheme IX farnesyltransferase